MHAASQKLLDVIALTAKVRRALETGGNNNKRALAVQSLLPLHACHLLFWLCSAPLRSAVFCVLSNVFALCLSFLLALQGPSGSQKLNDASAVVVPTLRCVT